jgi:hypothetical protein
MRILNAASRRGIEMPYVQAEPLEHTHKVTLLLNLNPKQIGQLCRDWRAVVDVIDVQAGAPLKDAFDHSATWTPTAHPPASVTKVAEAAASA